MRKDQSILKNLEKVYPTLQDIFDAASISKTQSNSKTLILNYKRRIQGSVEYQQYLLDNGHIPELMKMNWLHPEIEDKLTDVRKLEEWS